MENRNEEKKGTNKEKQGRKKVRGIAERQKRKKGDRAGSNAVNKKWERKHQMKEERLERQGEPKKIRRL